MNNNSTSLDGRKILVTAYDLEQSEHRGIAVYTKALIHCLRRAGAEVWLLTEFNETLTESGLKILPANNRAIISNAKTLNFLAHGNKTKPASLFQRKLGLTKLFKLLGNGTKLIIEMLRRPRHYRKHSLRKFRLEQLFDSPYPRMERLSYLQDLEGIVCAPNIFLATQVAANMRQQKPVRIDLFDFDALITSCPLNLIPENVPSFVQTVHDLIPLEFVAHNEDPLMFSHRLQACLPARRLFVSQSTATKFDRHIKTAHKKVNTKQAVIVQPPSLRFPSWLTADPERISDLRPTSYLLSNDEIETNLIDKIPLINEQVRKNKVLHPFRYFLFNSSVEARKNLLFLAQAYAESDLSKLGIQLCVTGKLKGDDYSKAVQNIVKNEPGILLTGYVDESTKLDLYLNALGLVSPSLVEGFGIPVLDGACLGMPTIASDCESHLEIQALHDFKDSVITLETLKSRNWASAMQAIAGLNSDLWKNETGERKRRIGRYENMKNSLYNSLQIKLEEILA